MSRFRDFVDIQYVVPEDGFKCSAVKDVIGGEFDRTFAFSEEFKNVKEMTLQPGENLSHGETDDGSVIYKFNNEYYRSDDFTTDKNNRFHILYAGCSESEGMGGPINDVWTHQLHTQLKNQHDVGGFYSISRSGYGWQKIISNFLIYEKKYGTPTHLFVLIPNLVRKFSWKEDIGIWYYDQKWPEIYPKHKLSERSTMLNNESINKEERYITIEEHRESLIDFVAGWKLFEAYCESKNVKLVWSTWNYSENPNLIKMGFNNFVEIDPKDFHIFLEYKYGHLRIERHDLEKRDGHSGRKVNMFWAEVFLREISRRGLFDDKQIN